MEQNKNSFLQSCEWGEFQKSLGKKVFRLDNVQIIKEKIPFIKRSFLYIPFCPIIEEKLFKLFLKETQKLAKQEKAIFLLVEPIASIPRISNFLIKPSIKRIQPQKTLILDLTKSKEEIFKKFSYRVRYNIKLSQRKGVKIEFKNEYIPEFYELLKKTSKRNKFRPFEEKHYKKLFEIKSDIFKVKMCLAFFEKKLITAYILVFFNNTATCLHGASDSDFYNLKAPNFLQWEQMKLAKSLGCEKYDFWGIDEKKWPGVTFFKKSFKGREIEYPQAIDIVFDDKRYGFYRFFRAFKGAELLGYKELGSLGSLGSLGLEKILKILSKRVLAKQKPQIVTITGSIGKTTTKEAVYSVLAKKFKARRSVKNYNNEIGIPLTIFGSRSFGKNVFAWFFVIIKAIVLSFFKSKSYPEVLVLEIAADKPGDLKYLMEMFPKELISASILTAVSPTHLEFFKTMENLFKEKIVPFSYLSKTSFAIINKDNCDFEKAKQSIFSKIISYSAKTEANVMSKNIRIENRGLVCDLIYKDNSLNFLLKDAVSEHQIYSVLAGIAAGIAFGMELEEIKQGLSDIKVLAGRMRKIKGINNSLIIDDTYNSSPEAAKAALLALKNLSFGKRKIIILSDMLELGKNSQRFHHDIGRIAAESGVDYLFTIGKQAENIFIGAVDNNMNKENVYKFENKEKLIQFLKSFVKQDDIILIKGSQGMRMEKVVKKLMFKPDQAEELLVRQGREWQNQ